jgi:DNA-binding transcriptional LysR family regulator
MEQVSLDAYRIFCEVVRAGSISAAAKELYLTQPAVSMAIKQLENHLGKPLFNRSVKGMKPTAEGEVLHSYLEQAFALIASGEEKYRAMTDLREGEVKIGAGDTILSHYLLPYIGRFTEKHSDIVIKATNRTTVETVNMLKAGQVDAGFINLPLPEEDPQLSVVPCLQIHDCLVGGLKYTHLAEKGLHIKDLERLPLMLLENESNSRRYLNAWAQESNCQLRPGIELGSYDLLLQFAEINLGLTFAVREFLPKKSNRLKEIPLTPPVPARNIGLAVLKGVRLSAAAEEFVNECLRGGYSITL